MNLLDKLFNTKKYQLHKKQQLRLESIENAKNFIKRYGLKTFSLRYTRNKISKKLRMPRGNFITLEGLEYLSKCSLEKLIEINWVESLPLEWYE